MAPIPTGALAALPDVVGTNAIEPLPLDAGTLEAPATYIPLIGVRMPAVTVAVCGAGVTYPGTEPKLTVYVPGGIDCHMPQSSRGTPFTKIVAGNAGLVVTRREPCATKGASHVVVTPAVTVKVCGAGGV